MNTIVAEGEGEDVGTAQRILYVLTRWRLSLQSHGKRQVFFTTPLDTLAHVAKTFFMQAAWIFVDYILQIGIISLSLSPNLTIRENLCLHKQHEIIRRINYCIKNFTNPKTNIHEKKKDEH